MGGVFFVNGMTFASWFPRLPELRDELAVSETALGLTLVGGGIGGLAVSVISGRVVDRVGSRTATVATSIGLSLLLPCVALAPSAPVLFAALLVLGALDGMTDVAMNSQAVDLQLASGRSIISRMHAMWSTGAVTGGLVASRAAGAGVTLRAQLVATGLVLAALTIVAARWLLPGATRTRHVEPDESPVRAPRALLVRLFTVGIAVALTELPLTDWAALMMSDRFDLSSGRAALGFVAVASGMLAGRLVGDRITDRLGLERTRRSGALVALAGTIVAATIPSSLAAGLGLLLAGLGISALFPVMFRAAGELTVSSSGMAAFASGARLGILVSSPLVGVLADPASVAIGVLIVSGAAAIVVAATSLPPTTERQIAPTAE